MIRRYLLFSVLLVLIVSMLSFMNRPLVRAASVSGDPAGEQVKPSGIKFSHSLHVEQNGTECATCHATAQTSKSSSDNLAAGHESCSTCHEEQVNNTCGYCHTDPENIQERVVSVRSVNFSHENHLARKDVTCQTCHASVVQSNDVADIALPSMTTCTTCHNDRNATNTCETCHTNFVSLVPADHKQSDFIRNHRDIARLGGLDASCQTCHTETFCQQCHQGAGLKAFGPRDRMSDPGPKISTQDGADQMRLQNVHELNYRFTHGIDAKARQSDCASCHTIQEFCVQCHEAGGNITQGKFKPSSHSLPGFVTLGHGSGGGIHAEDARADLESCISCHDVEGRDPVCLTCHTDNGRIR